MVEIIDPQAPTITIRLLRNGQLAFNFPADKMTALSMLSVARAILERDLIGPIGPLMVPPNGHEH